MNPLPVVLAAALAVGVGAAGCASSQARAIPEPPRLAIPLPPPRVVDVVEVVPPPPPVEEPAVSPAPAGSKPAPAARPSRTAEAPRADSTPTTAAGVKPEDAPRVPSLQTLPQQQGTQEEQRVRAALGAAERSLAGVDYRALGSDERTQYDQAKGFIREAEDALKARNLVFARSLADKAATLATQLAGR